MKVVAVVPIKLNNERLPGKNTRLLGGKPLLYYVQEMLLAVPEIMERYVYCSKDAVMDYLLPGITCLQRPEKLDLPASNFTQIFQTFLKDVRADIYVYAHATAPFIEAATTRKCIEAVKSGKYDSAFTASRIQDFLWKDGEPMNFDASNIPRSQDLAPIYRESSGVYVYTREVFERDRRRIGRKPYIAEISYKEAVDINTAEDFQLAECLVRMGERNRG